MNTQSEVAAVSLLGRDHALVGRNLQDHAVAWSGTGPTGSLAALAVSDGCGEGEGSEVGARITALVACRAARVALESDEPLGSCVRIVGGEVLVALATVCAAVGGPSATDRFRFAAEHLAATLWMVVARGSAVVVFGWGDGLVRIGDRVLSVDEGGRPSYLLRALGAGGAVPTTVPQPTGRLDARLDAMVAVATDGWDEASLLALANSGGDAALLRWMRLRQRGRDCFRDDAAVARLTPARGER